MADENNDEQHFENFEAAGGDNASKTYPMQCSALRKGGHVVLKGRPCKIIDMSTSKTGKHGHAKVNMTGIDIFTGKKYEDMSPSTHNMDVPVIGRVEYLLMYIDDDFLVLQTLDGSETREDIKAPDNEVGEEINRLLDEGREMLVTILSAMGEEHAVSVKEAPKNMQE
ncbi:translation initiation factor eIF5A [Coemansia sp. RSA 1933]|nr:translation initiation factor eIF5A [Coemansia sp. RSA 1933]